MRRIYGLLVLVGLVATAGCLGTGGGTAEQTGTSEPGLDQDANATPPGADSERAREGPERAGADTSDPRWFREVSDTVGFDYRPRPAVFVEGIVTHGVFVADVDGDDFRDVLAVGTRKPPVLFGNDGDGFVREQRFSPIDNVTGALFFDQNQNGRPDLLFLTADGPVFYRNDGGTFVRRDVGLPSFDRGRTASAADGDGDGCLDLLVARSPHWRTRRPAGYHDTDLASGEDNGRRNLLFDGDCETFENVTETAGIEGTRWSLAASFVDVDGDGHPDVHVANDFNNDVVYWNDGDGTFTRHELGDVTDRNGMASEVADIDGDGALDVFVTNIHHERGSIVKRKRVMSAAGNNLLINQGNRSFVDRAESYGLDSGGWGWATVATDFDNDADIDIFHSTTFDDSFPSRGAFWIRNDDGFVAKEGPGRRFARASELGAASLDVDRDGRQDLVTATYTPRDDGTTYNLYRNVHPVGRWLRIEIVNDDGPALGTRVVVETSDGRQLRTVHANADYIAQDSRVVHVGLGNASTAQIRATYPDDTTATIADVRANSSLVVTKRDGDVGCRALEDGRRPDGRCTVTEEGG